MTNPAQPSTSFEQLAASALAAANTPKHRFEIPVSLQKLGIKAITLRELTGNDEINAHTTAQGAPGAKMAYELCKASIHQIEKMNGSTVDITPNNVELEFGSLPPKLRGLALAAYSDIHNPKEDEIGDFLGSRQVRV